MSSDAHLRVALIDDEPPALAELRRQVARHEALLSVGEAVDGPAAVELLERTRPDLVLLDVQLPGLDGFEVLDALSDDVRPAVVFVTAHDRFALRAFEAQAADYLLKPYDDERFDTALARAVAHLRAGTSSLDRLLQTVALERAGANPARRMAARDGRGFRLIDLDLVDRCEAARNYVRLFTDGEEVLARTTIAALARRLDPGLFLRVHRSHVVRVDAVERVERTASGDAELHLTDGAVVPVGRSHRNDVLARLGMG